MTNWEYCSLLDSQSSSVHHSHVVKTAAEGMHENIAAVVEDLPQLVVEEDIVYHNLVT